MSYARGAQQDNRDDRGRYDRGPACDACGKPAGHDYTSLPSDQPDEGHVLCARARCGARIQNLATGTGRDHDDRPARAEIRRLRAARGAPVRPEPDECPQCGAPWQENGGLLECSNFACDHREEILEPDTGQGA